MAISWVTVLAAVPWDEVIKNAPKVADSAKKLWGSVGRKRGADAAVQVTTAHSGDLNERVVALETMVDELHKQMQASAELINALAEQHTQLVRRIELNRRRLLGLSIVVLLLFAALLFVAQR